MPPGEVRGQTSSAPELSFLGDLPLARDAVALALERHFGQRRAGDEAAFVLHPLEVASLLDRSDYPDHVVAAGVLHDVLEDTETDAAELRERFGPEVCELVELVSDDPGIADVEERRDDVRERVRREGGYAAVVYAADKISKVRELRIMIARGLSEEAAGRLDHYRRSRAMLEGVIPESRLVELLRFEVEALEKLPPGSARGPA
jgi:(p)ppGpp synthase/HD superfamily hydrolase